MSTALIEVIASTGSTNSDLVARIGSGLPPGEEHWLVADRQHAGRGRAGREWHDGHGNFMGSTVVALRPGDPLAPTLSLVAGVALHRAVAPLADAAYLKWPNDVLIDGAKLAGILTERAGQFVVVGIGVNLVAAPQVADRRTVALAGVTRDAFAQSLAGHWQSALAAWHCGDWPALRAEWQARAHPMGTLLHAQDAELGAITGAFAGLDPSGAALLRLADGCCRAIHAGDIDEAG